MSGERGAESGAESGGGAAWSDAGLSGLVGDADEVRAVFDALPIGLCALDGPDLRWVAANAAYRQVAGGRPLIGLAMREVLTDLEGQQLMEMDERVYASGGPVIARGWRVQLDVGGGELQERYLDFEIHPRRGEDDAVRGVLVQVADVTDRVLQEQAAERAITEARARYQAARDVVVELQQALLPTGLPVLPHAQIAARYLVAERDQAAGGDWFDALALHDGRIALVIGDVVGHGVAASAAMGQARAVFDELLTETGDVEQALARIDRMAARIPALRATTLVVAILDPVDGRLRYATCGHPPPLVITEDGRSRFLRGSGGGPLGTGSSLAVVEDVLAAGEVLLLYSDGLIEQPGRTQAAGMDTLAEVAGDAVANRALRIGGPDAAVERACQQSVELLTRSGYDDDVTVLAAQRRPAPIEPLSLQATATPQAVAEARHAIRVWLAQLEPTVHDQRLVDLAVAELVTNTVEHAYPPGQPGPVRVAAELNDTGVLRLLVADDGTWIDPSATPPDLSGRGLWMVGELADQITTHGSRKLDQTDAEAAAAARYDQTAVEVRHRIHRPAVLAADPISVAEKRRSMPFSIRINNGPPRTLHVAGSVDITSAGEFADRLNVASRGGVHPLVLDLTQVEVLASAGVSVLFAARDHHATHGTVLTLLAEPDSVAEQVLTLVGLDHQPPASPAES